MGHSPVVTRFYQVRRPGHWWARFWVTSDGCVSIMSDWGNWGYWWTHPGCELREFLCKLDEHYLLGKLCMGQRETINAEATERSIKETIVSLRRQRALEREEARAEWDLVRSSDFGHDIGAHEWYLETKLGDAAELLRYEKSRSCQAFIHQAWPLFVQELRRDIGAPLRTAAASWFMRHSSDATGPEILTEVDLLAEREAFELAQGESPESWLKGWRSGSRATTAANLRTAYRAMLLEKR